MDKSSIASKNLENLIKKDKYSVLIFACPAYLPFIFAKHPWFVLNKKGIISRWEIRHSKNKPKDSHLFINYQKPFQGIQIFFFPKKIFWKAKLVGYIEGTENSSAQKMIEFIENSEKEYPFCSKYSLIGPNSNTYIQWVLDKFPEFKVKLSWRFVGKNFKSK